MTKKDFELIANTIRFSHLWSISPHVAYTTALEMADALAKTNSLFDRQRFIRACTPAGMDGSYADLTVGSVSTTTKHAMLVNDFEYRNVPFGWDAKAFGYKIEVDYTLNVRFVDAPDAKTENEKLNDLVDALHAIPNCNGTIINMGGVAEFGYQSLSEMFEATSNVLEKVHTALENNR